MNKEELILREYLRRTKKVIPDLRPHLFDKQLRVENDKSRFVAALCTRRAGKSRFAGTKLIIEALKRDNVTVPYVALTRQSAKNIIMPVIRELNIARSLGGQIKESTLTVSFPNGSQIFMVGADTANFIDRLRGGKYPIAIIDEAQSFREHIGSLIDDVLTPAVSDYNGQIYLLGTPGPTPSGYFYDATNGKAGFSVHKWSVLDNPFMPNARDFVANLKKQKGWTDDNPTYKREWLGEWVEDIDSLVYKFNKTRNVFKEKPDNHEWYRVLGIDYGWNDQTAFAVVSYSTTNKNVFVEHAQGFSELHPSLIAEKVKSLVERYSPVKIVADTGGLGKSITEEMVRRYQIPIKPAQKTEKLSFISLLNGDFIDGRLFVHESCRDLMDQYKKLDKDDKGVERSGVPNDLCDAVLYSYREARGYAAQPPPPKPKTVAEKYEQEEKRMLDEEIESWRKQEEREWWEN